MWNNWKNSINGSPIAHEIMNDIKRNERMKKEAEKQKQMSKKIKYEINDELIFTGQHYNIAKIYDYETTFKDKKLIVEKILRCPCEQGYNDKIKFKGVEGYFRAVFFSKKEG